MKAILISIMGVLAGASLLAGQVYVSPAGSDSNNGSASAPFRTLEKARVASSGGGLVTLMPGTYYLDETLVLKSSDSGTKAKPLVFKAGEEGTVILSGGVELEGLNWQKTASGAYKAKVPAKYISDEAFDQLYVNGVRALMARYPNWHPKGYVFGGVDIMENLVKRAKAMEYKHPETGYLHGLHQKRWGSSHYQVTGFDGEAFGLEGGWQQNRMQGYSDRAVFVENIFEELDASNEWFFDRSSSTLYFFPEEGFDFKSATFETTRLRELVRFEGSEAQPVRYINFEGLEFRHANRTFMDEYEGLLRGDWSIVRSAAVLMTGTEYCAIRDCFFNQLGGTGIFFNNYNRYSEVTGSRFHKLGESAVVFVGNFDCVREVPVGYENNFDWDDMDETPGPNGNDYPRYCRMDNCLVFNIGRVSKQTAGAFISMAENITISHNTIYHVPRSGITVNDGSWGGHIIEHNDVFDTVIETGDHGPFNSWGRDRHWMTRFHGAKAYRTEPMGMSQKLAQQRAKLETRTPIIIRNNRWFHDTETHTWGIDLDDGSSNYEIYNNLTFGCSLKLREGFYRVVRNNIFYNCREVHFHVPFDYHQDVFVGNVIVNRTADPLWGHKDPIRLTDSKEMGSNVYWPMDGETERMRELVENAQKELKVEIGSIVADPLFVDPSNLDLTLKADSPAIKMGFKNFPMDQFGVRKPEFRKIAEEGHQRYNRYLNPELEERILHPWRAHQKGGVKQSDRSEKVETLLGAQLKDMTTEAEKSTAGVGEIDGVYVVSVQPGSMFDKAGLLADDAILKINGNPLHTLQSLKTRLARMKGEVVKLYVVGYKERTIEIQL